MTEARARQLIRVFLFGLVVVVDAVIIAARDLTRISVLSIVLEGAEIYICIQIARVFAPGLAKWRSSR